MKEATRISNKLDASWMFLCGNCSCLRVLLIRLVRLDNKYGLEVLLEELLHIAMLISPEAQNMKSPYRETYDQHCGPIVGQSWANWKQLSLLAQINQEISSGTTQISRIYYWKHRKFHRRMKIESGVLTPFNITEMHKTLVSNEKRECVILRGNFSILRKFNGVVLIAVKH